jgi:hypothetical protein
MHQKYNEEPISIDLQTSNQLMILQELLTKWKITSKEYKEKIDLLIKIR